MHTLRVHDQGWEDSPYEEFWTVPDGVTGHQLNKWFIHAEERLDLAMPYLKRRDVAVQAGANLGIWPVLLIETYGFKWVHTFEPDLENMKCVLANTKDTRGVACCQAALGQVAGRVGWLKDHKGRPGWHKVAPHLDGGTELCVDVLTIDEIPLLADYDQVDLIALDVEGYELEALMGAEKTLMRDKPVVIVEDLGRSKFKSFRRLSGTAYGHPPGAVGEWLSARGYREAELIKNDAVWVHN